MPVWENPESRCHQDHRKNSWFGQFQIEMKLLHKTAQVILLAVFRLISRKKNDEKINQSYQDVRHQFSFLGQ